MSVDELVSELLEDIVFADLEELKKTAKNDHRVEAFHAESNGKWIELVSIRVNPEFRRQGVGSTYVMNLLRIASELGQPVIVAPEAEARHKEDLRRFYRRLGFRPNRGRRSRSDLGGAFGGEWVWEPK